MVPSWLTSSKRTATTSTWVSDRRVARLYHRRARRDSHRFSDSESRRRGGAPIAYLDASATSQKPACVIDAEADFYRRSNGAVHRGTHLLGDEATDAFESARGALASFVGVSADEIVWTKNATEAINLVALSMGNASQGMGGAESASLRVGPGDRIVCTRAEHHANIVPWQQLCQRTGAELAWLDLTPDGRIDLETLSVITPNTRLVAFTHVSNVTGAVSPVAAVSAAARAVGALVLLDTCQSSAHMALNLSELDVDFAVFSSHKMLGPTGAGALWGRRSLLAAMPPVLTGGSMIEWVTMEESTFMAPPERFEAGSQPVAQIAAWSQALRYMSALGMDRVEAHEHALTSMMLDGISSIDGIRVLGPDSDVDRIGVVAFAVDGVHPTTWVSSWTRWMSPSESGTTVRSHCIRSSRCVPPHVRQLPRRLPPRKLNASLTDCRRCAASSVSRIARDRWV